VSPTEAKTRVLLYLLLTDSPLRRGLTASRPLIDKSANGRRILVAIVGDVRAAVLCWMNERNPQLSLALPLAFLS